MNEIEIVLNDKDGKFLRNAKVESTPDIIVWGNRYFIKVYKDLYREAEIGRILNPEKVDS